MQDTGETRNEFEDITNKILHELFNIKDKNETNNEKKEFDNGEDDIIYKDLDEDWWFNPTFNFNNNNIIKKY